MKIHKKDLIRNDDKDDKDKKQQSNNIDTKPSNDFNYLKSLSQEANDLIDEIEEVNNDIDKHMLFFIGNNKEKFNFNTFRMPLNFLSDIYNGKISLKEAQFKQKDLEKEIENLQFYYIPKNKEEKEKIKKVLRHAKESLECRDKIINAFKDNTFSSEYLKKSDNAAYDFTLKVVNKFIGEIKSMEEKINLSLFKECFEYSSPTNYAKELINTKNWDENKERVKEIQNIRFRRRNKKNEWKRKKRQKCEWDIRDY